MNFLRSIGTDLVERRLWPIPVGLAVALVAVVILVGGGSGSTPTPPAVAAAPVSPPAGPSVTAATPNPHQALAETTTGLSYQNRGNARNPFQPLPGSKGSSAATAAVGQPTGNASSAHTTSATGTSSSGGGSSTPATPTPPTPQTTPANTGGSSSGGSKSSPKTTPKTTPKSPAKQPTYKIDFHFGLVPTASSGTTGPTGPSTPTQNVDPSSLPNYSNVKGLTPLPDANAPLVMFVGVRKDGKTAVFALLSESILHGPGLCIPSATNCEAIELSAGQIETFDYDSPSLGMIRFELAVTSVGSGGSTTGSSASLTTSSSAKGLAVLAHHAPKTLEHLRLTFSRNYLAAPPATKLARSSSRRRG